MLENVNDEVRAKLRFRFGLLLFALAMNSKDSIKLLAGLLARRERTVSGHLLVEFHNCGIAWQFPDSGLQ